MERKYIIMVINDIFEGDHMLITKGNGGHITVRFEHRITIEKLHESLERNNINVDSCVINVVEEDWKRNPIITRW